MPPCASSMPTGARSNPCGNAARCVARLLMEEKDASSVRIETPGGPLLCTDAGRDNVTVDMGTPRFGWREIPLDQSVDTNGFPLTVGGATFTASAVSVGNPHCVLFMDDAEKADVAGLGPAIERHPLFPARTNVEFVSVLSPSRLRMRVWERGAGITRACGTGRAPRRWPHTGADLPNAGRTSCSTAARSPSNGANATITS